MTKARPKMTADTYLKTEAGQENYDKEIARLNENRIRFAQWKKEENKRKAARAKRRDNSH